MAGLLRAARRTFVSSSSSFKTPTSRFEPPSHQMKRPSCNSLFQSRNFMADMRKSTFDGNILRILRNEIQYEREYAPPKQPATEFKSFTIEDRPGEQLITLRGKWGEKENIKIDVTMFDGFVHVPKFGEDSSGDDVKFHISLIVGISKWEESGVLEFVCSAWPDCLEIQNVYLLRREGLRGRPYVGHDYKNLKVELRDSLRDFLELRGVNDQLAVFLHDYIMNKDRSELIQWMEPDHLSQRHGQEEDEADEWSIVPWISSQVLMSLPTFKKLSDPHLYSENP